MNQRLLWTTTALLTTALALPSVGLALESQPVDRPVKDLKAKPTHTLPSAQPTKALKQAPANSPSLQAAPYMVIARVQPHELAGRMAATLYVRNVPVLTFVGESPVATNSTKVDEFQLLNAPILRAHAVAAQINKMYRDNVDASTIRAVWEPGDSSLFSSKSKGATKTSNKSDRYLIKVKDAVLVEINSLTRLPDTNRDRAKDALQATNRLRQLIGNAPPLQEISGKLVALPRDRFLSNFSLAKVISRISGMASWYGFKDNGSETASGEVFRENALTAAHLSLPFGTQVLVTNLLNGRSVVVRINDRGPYVQGRIIDLSTAAAGLLGMIEPGVVPVNVDVLSQQRPAKAK